MDGSLAPPGKPTSIRTACPHDCPSACVLEVERLSPRQIGRVRGSGAFDYTAGTCCAKVARYAERTHHPDRLTSPLLRLGAKGEGRFAPIGWDEALDRIAEAFRGAAARHGPEAVWPYHSGGTMGVLARWGLDRLRHWPVSISYFDRAASDSEQTPKFIFGADLFENGIAGALRLDYGNFVVSGKLVGLDVLPAGACTKN